MIRTVLGDIEKSELGATMCHEHFIIDLDRVRHDGVSKIETVEEVVPEIKMMMELGVKSAIEVSTIDLSRDVLKLKEIAFQTGLNIICSTGFYLSEYHPDWMDGASVEEIADIYVKELMEGIDDTGIKAGIIAEIASSPNSFVKNEKKILEAAGMAAKKVGCAVSTHTSRYTAMETIDTLLACGMDPDKIIIGHQDLIDDSQYHLSLLERGVNIAFDTCGKVSYMADEVRARNAVRIIEAGYGDHLMVSDDVSRRSYFVAHGGVGYLAAYKTVLPLMKEYGATDEDIYKITTLTPARVLDNEWK